jgi:hypothetical protein
MVGVHFGAAYGPAKVWVRERIVEFCRLTPGVIPVLLGRRRMSRRLRRGAETSTVVWFGATARISCRRCSRRWPC